jgi:hypothetical protein
MGAKVRFSKSLLLLLFPGFFGAGPGEAGENEEEPESEAETGVGFTMPLGEMLKAVAWVGLGKKIPELEGIEEDIGIGEKEVGSMETGEGLKGIGEGVMPSRMVKGEGVNVWRPACVGAIINGDGEEEGNGTGEAEGEEEPKGIGEEGGGVIEMGDGEGEALPRGGGTGDEDGDREIW